MNILTKATIGLVAGATALTAAAPAEAQYRRYHRGGGGDVATGAIIGGIAGLAVGAAIASDRRDRYYDRRFYGPRHRGGYYGPNQFYGPRNYYNPRRAYRQRCVGREFDPYTGRSYRVRYC